MTNIIMTDDTDAFGGHFGTIKIRNKLMVPISRIEVVTNSGTCIPNKKYTDENNFLRELIEITVDYSSEETSKLNQGSNTLNIVTYDIANKQKTCPQTLTFYAQNGVISRHGQSCC